MAKKLKTPRWYKNTYFWIAAILMVVALVGIARGEEVIRDPGQTDEPGLVIIYLVGAAVMVINGLLSHNQYKKLYEEQNS